MALKSDLPDWVEDALRVLGGSGNIVATAQIIWRDHESELRSSGSLFFTWQYDMRWAATKLRQTGRMKNKELSPKGIWELS